MDWFLYDIGLRHERVNNDGYPMQSKRIVKKGPGTRDWDPKNKDPKNLGSKNQDPKHQDPKNLVSLNQDPWNNFLKTNVSLSLHK